MSELKAIESATAVIENVHMVYRKSEADKVIAELKAREDVLVTDNRDLLEKVKMLEERLRENAEHFKRNEAQILENADKVIADLEESHKMEVEQLLMEIVKLKKERDWLAKDRAQAYRDLEKRAQLNIKQEESIHHHKYKRCFAMAKWCRTSAQYDMRFGAFKYSERYWKWYKRWLAIAEKFKEYK